MAIIFHSFCICVLIFLCIVFYVSHVCSMFQIHYIYKYICNVRITFEEYFNVIKKIVVRVFPFLLPLCPFMCTCYIYDDDV